MRPQGWWVHPSLPAPCARGSAEPRCWQQRLSHPLPSRCCPRGPTCQASAPLTVGATGAVSKPGEGWPSGEATMEGSTRGCEGGRTGERLGRGVPCVFGLRSLWSRGVPGWCSASQLCTSHAGVGGRMEKDRSILLESWDRNVSRLSHAVSIALVSVGSAGAWWLVRLGHRHFGGDSGVGKD